MFDDTILKALHERVILTNIASAVDTAFLKREASVWLPFLKDEEWRRMTDIHNAIVGSSDEELDAFVHEHTKSHPSVSTVSKFYGSDIVGRYRAVYDPHLPKRKHWTRARVECTVELLLSTSRNEQRRIKRTYEQRLRERRKHYRNRNRNNGNMQRAHALNIWLPVRDEWDPEFMQLATECREALRKERCLLQYISKRRRTMKTELDRERCMQAMRTYLFNAPSVDPIL